MTDRGSLVVLLCAEDGWIDGMEASHVDGCLPPAGGRERGREHPQPQRAASAELIEPQRAAASPSEIPAAQFSCAIDFFLRDRVRNWTSKPAGPGCARPALDVAKQRIPGGLRGQHLSASPRRLSSGRATSALHDGRRRSALSHGPLTSPLEATIGHLSGSFGGRGARARRGRAWHDLSLRGERAQRGWARH